MAAKYSAEEYARTYPQPELDAGFTKGRLQDKVAIVTGGNSGIGRAIVERLSSDGAIVAIFARGEERGNAVVEEVNATGGRVSFYKVDLFDRERCEEAVRQVAEANNERIDILVNNAVHIDGLSTNFVDTPLEWFDKSMSANVVSCAALAKACFPYLKKGGLGSSIVNITSISSYIAQPTRAQYNTSKAGLLMLTKCMALDMSSSGVRVNSVSPGWTWTPLIGDYLSKEEFFEKHPLYQMTKRIIPGSGIASVVAFLCSQDASYMTGSDVHVDLGYTSMGPEGLGPFAADEPVQEQ